ncbi:thiol peroxidase [Flavobacteriaceae bacterium R38]|nr:thiol peroxidase [Flavobacteriaceae bacterium R38]
MSAITFKDQAIEVKGTFPQVGDTLPELRLIKSDLSELNTSDLKGKKVVFNIFPSVDTSVCALQLKQFSNQLKDREDVVLVFASLDLPFAFSRFCAAEGIENAITTSDFKYKSLENMGVLMESGPLAGLYARGVLVTDENLNVVHSELVSEVVNEPDYEASLKHI